jgi:hypothetical protein
MLRVKFKAYIIMKLAIIEEGRARALMTVARKFARNK